MTFIKKIEAKALGVGSRVFVKVGGAEYLARVLAETTGGRGQLLSFSARIIGSGAAPVRCWGKDEGQTWRQAKEG